MVIIHFVHAVSLKLIPAERRDRQPFCRVPVLSPDSLSRQNGALIDRAAPTNRVDMVNEIPDTFIPKSLTPCVPSHFALTYFQRLRVLSCF